MTSRKRRSTGITAAELAAQLSADAEYQAQRAKADADLAAQEDAWRRAEAPLVEDLQAAGCAVESVWELVNTDRPYPTALPVLLDHLPREYPDRVREGIARALAVSDASFGWSLLREQYQVTDEPGTKDGLAAALAATVTSETVDELIELARDPAHGDSRLLLLRGFRRLGSSKARAALESLSSDPTLGREASRLLRGGE